jgi:hypothetical protein
MTDLIAGGRVENNATAAGIAIDAETAAGIAYGVNPTAKRFRSGNPSLPFETEPASYVLIATTDAKR